MKRETKICLLLLSALVICPTTEARRKDKKNKAAMAALVKDTVNADYKKISKNAATQKGLFTTLYNAKEGKLYFEIPDSAFNHIYILANRVAAISNTQEYVAGQIATQPLLIRFTKDERNVYMHEIQGLRVMILFLQQIPCALLSIRISTIPSSKGSRSSLQTEKMW